MSADKTLKTFWSYSDRNLTVHSFKLEWAIRLTLISWQHSFGLLDDCFDDHGLLSLFLYSSILNLLWNRISWEMEYEESRQKIKVELVVNPCQVFQWWRSIGFEDWKYESYADWCEETVNDRRCSFRVLYLKVQFLSTEIESVLKGILNRRRWKFHIIRRDWM